ncbi:CBS domain-containing protein [Desulfospira joergensenii]|uniref:CBS domain-containing protein n=1 Tax=Desulfospira joergensenii TaxID=53329 RepID=UPI0003B39348|nr:CBS domain-containing protein [Desulfospira joergensenii]
MEDLVDELCRDADSLPMDAPLTRVMTADVVTIGPDAFIIVSIRMLENHEISAMPVVEDEKVLGGGHLRGYFGPADPFPFAADHGLEGVSLPADGTDYFHHFYLLSSGPSADQHEV